jgi:hypothetical protein
MRYRLALCALIFGTVCGTVAGETLRSPTVLTIIVKGAQPPPAVLQSLQREAQLAIGPSGVRMDWRSQDLGGADVGGEVAIIQFRGNCGAARTFRGSRASLDSEPLGQTHMVNGKVLPFADVLCDAVHRLIDQELQGTRVTQRDEMMGRALGRVVAHELYHILARTTDHAGHGLTRPEQSRAELLAPNGSLEETSEHRIAESIGADSGGAGR